QQRCKLLHGIYDSLAWTEPPTRRPSRFLPATWMPRRRGRCGSAQVHPGQSGCKSCTPGRGSVLPFGCTIWGSGCTIWGSLQPLEPVLQRPPAEPEEPSRPRDVAARLVERLEQQATLERLEVEPVLGDLDRDGARRGLTAAQPHLGGQVDEPDHVVVREQERALDDRLELAHVARPRVLDERLERLRRD